MLSKNFYRTELTASSTADEMGINNEPSEENLIALAALVNVIMQPIRDYYGVRVIVSSGYRGSALNVAIGGSPTSQHSLGEACDFTVDGHNCRDVAEWISEESGLDFDQLIWERSYDKRGNIKSEWLHISYKRQGGNRGEVLSAYARSSGTEYLTGLR